MIIGSYDLTELYIFAPGRFRFVKIAIVLCEITVVVEINSLNGLVIRSQSEWRCRHLETNSTLRDLRVVQVLFDQ
jgi:hypothetical protein